ncbi:MFS general substrate transporter [Meredithblackwellia eburnea MCA 4105]
MTASSSSTTKARPQLASGKVVRIVFLALVCDLLAFTMPLPLFPRLINDFVEKEAAFGSASPTLLSNTLNFVRSLRKTLFSYSKLAPLSEVANARWDLTLLGGLLASLFSLCQFVISPHLGALSDRHGRRTVLLLSMLGNLLSAGLWLFAHSFGLYALSRVVGGLSEGNVQLSIAVISDVTSPETRSRSLALVGVAFSIAFTLGPSLGAYFASRVFGKGSLVSVAGREVQLNSYAVPAAMTLALLTIETLYLFVALPETRWYKEGKNEQATDKTTAKVTDRPRTYAERLERLRQLQWIHLWFLYFFSGAEFTLTFLTYNLFNYTNAQNGKLLGFIGILSSLLQGGYVRRRGATVDGPQKLARSGILTCAVSLFLLTVLPHVGGMGGWASAASVLLYSASAGLAFVSATVVNSLNAMASLECSSTALEGEDGKEIDKGLALGKFRSRGQLGRATGPLVATVTYWILGPSYAYGIAALGAGAVAFKISRLGRSGGIRSKGSKEL